MNISSIRFVTRKDGSVGVTFETDSNLKYVEENFAIQEVCRLSNILKYTGIFVRKMDHRELFPIVLKDGIYYECTNYQFEYKWLFIYEGKMCLQPISNFNQVEYYSIKEVAIKYTIFSWNTLERKTFAYRKEELKDAREAILKDAKDIEDITISNNSFTKKEFFDLIGLS